MKKILIFVVLILIVCGLGYFFSTQKKAQTEKPIVVSGYVPYTFTRALAGKDTPIIMLLPPGAEPHSFEPTPGVLVQLKNAKAFIYVSDELEPWAADLAKLAGPNTRVLQLAKLLAKSDDPHSWMNFEKAGLMVYQIAALLAELDPQQRSVTDKNWENLSAEIDALAEEFKRTLSTCKYKEVVHIGHLAFGEMLAPYGIKLTSLSGTSHEGEHSVKKIAALVREMKDKHLPALFTEETLSPRLAQAVAAETGVEILYLHPIEHISKSDFENNISYTQLMRRNLENLKRGLQCQAS